MLAKSIKNSRCKMQNEFLIFNFALLIVLARTTGFEPALSNLKGWRLNRIAYVLTGKYARGKIRTFTERCLKPLPLPVGLHAQTDFGFSIADFGLTLSYPKSKIRNLKSEIKLVSKAGFSPARVTFSQSFSIKKLCASPSIPPLRLIKNWCRR